MIASLLALVLAVQLSLPQLFDQALSASRDGRFGGVAVIGHSEGAALGALAAQRGGVVAYVSLAGPGRDAAAGLRGQLKGKLPPA